MPPAFRTSFEMTMSIVVVGLVPVRPAPWEAASEPDAVRVFGPQAP